MLRSYKLIQKRKSAIEAGPRARVFTVQQLLSARGLNFRSRGLRDLPNGITEFCYVCDGRRTIVFDPAIVVQGSCETSTSVVREVVISAADGPAHALGVKSFLLGALGGNSVGAKAAFLELGIATGALKIGATAKLGGAVVEVAERFQVHVRQINNGWCVKSLYDQTWQH